MTKLWPVSDLRTFLSGGWRLARRFDDRRIGQLGRMTGSAEFSGPLPDLLYREAGGLQFGDFAGAATRVYRYRFPRPDRAEVLFEDGRFFHDLDLADGVWRAEHACGDDRYRGTFRTAGPDAWAVRWQVSGPRKDLVIVTRYRRIRR